MVYMKKEKMLTIHILYICKTYIYIDRKYSGITISL